MAMGRSIGRMEEASGLLLGRRIISGLYIVGRYLEELMQRISAIADCA